MSYGYEQGQFATIPLAWDEAKGALTIGARIGLLPGHAREAAAAGRVRLDRRARAALGGAGGGEHARLRRQCGRDPAGAPVSR